MAMCLSSTFREFEKLGLSQVLFQVLMVSGLYKQTYLLQYSFDIYRGYGLVFG